MSGVEPMVVVDLVEQYLSKELHDAEKYDNRELLDESGIYSLHALAAEIYSRGFQDGTNTALRREDHIRRRWQSRLGSATPSEEDR